MSWVTIIWVAIASVCVTTAVLHVLVWFRRQAAWGHLFFALSATGTGLLACCELWMMRAATPVEFGLALRLCHLPAWLVIVSLVGFLQFHMRAGRGWLALTVCGLRTLSLILNFSFTPNLNYREITAIQQFRFLGESVTVAVGESNPWMLVGQVSLLLLVAFVVDAAWSVWRRGDRRQALVLGGSIACFTLAGASQAVLFLWGLISAPLMTSVFYLGFVVAMGYELSSDLLGAAQLADTLRQRETELSHERAVTDAVFDSVPGLLYLYTAEGKLVRWNRQHETRTGYSPAEMARMTAPDWFEGEDMEAVRAAWNQVFTGQGDIPMSVRAMKAGAVDFLTKPVDEAELLAAVRAALAQAARQQTERTALASERSRLETLTPRELEVLGHVIAGKLNKHSRSVRSASSVFPN